MKRYLPTLLCLMIVLISCEKRVGPYPSLSNQGLLPLSSTNAYVGSNIFLANEAERSSYLFNFLKGRGGPQAIEIIGKDFQPVEVYMYYPADKQVYVASLQTGEKFRQWIVRGPYAIERRTYRDLSQIVPKSEEPLFVIQGREYRFRRTPAEKPKTIELKLPPMPTPKPRPVKKPAEVVATVAPTPSGPVDPLEGKTVTGDLLAILMSQGYAERTLDGDLLHTVASADENLDKIARWYTGSAANAAEIGRVSGLTEQAALTLGVKIRIPKPLLKQFKAMPPTFK